MSGSERTNRKHTGIAGEGDLPEAAAPSNTEFTPCAFCAEQPSGSLGHEGFRQQVYQIPSTDRSYVRVTCTFCGSQWVRRRINAKTFEWLAFAN